MPALWPIVLVAANTALADMPKFSINPTCKGTTVNSPTAPPKDACKRDEEQARAQLQKQWTSFPVADRQHCASLTQMGGSPSYVELLTCLQIAREAAKLSGDKGLEGPVK